MYHKVQLYTSKFLSEHLAIASFLVIVLVPYCSGSIDAQPYLQPRAKTGEVSTSNERPSKTVEPRVTDRQIRAVILAVKDEIYVRNYEKEYLDVGPKDIPIYIFPNFENNLIWIIYRLMPLGEVVRGTYIRKDGLALLKGNPDDGFPASHGASMKTVYLDDDNLIKMKTTWKKYYFSVDLKPLDKEVQEARHRQELRLSSRIK